MVITPRFHLVQAAYLSPLVQHFENTGKEVKLLEHLYDETRKAFEAIESIHDGILRGATVLMGGVGLLGAVLLGLGKLIMDAAGHIGPVWTTLSWCAYVASLIFFGASLLMASRTFHRIPRFAPSLRGTLDIECGYDRYLMIQILTTVNVTESNQEINDWKAGLLHRATSAWRVGIAILVFYGVIFGLAGVLGLFNWQEKVSG